MSDNTIELPDGLDVGTARDVLREFGQTDDAQIVSESRLDSLQNEISEAKEAFAAVLAEESPQSADTLSEQSMAALTEPYRNDDGDIDVDTLRQEPETTSGGSGDSNGSNGGFDGESVGLSEKQELDTLAKKRTAFKNRDMDGRVAEIEAEMADLVDAPDYDTLESEVL